MPPRGLCSAGAHARKAAWPLLRLEPAVLPTTRHLRTGRWSLCHSFFPAASTARRPRPPPPRYTLAPSPHIQQLATMRRFFEFIQGLLWARERAHLGGELTINSDILKHKRLLMQAAGWKLAIAAEWVGTRRKTVHMRLLKWAQLHPTKIGTQQWRPPSMSLAREQDVKDARLGGQAARRRLSTSR